MHSEGRREWNSRKKEKVGELDDSRVSGGGERAVPTALKLKRRKGGEDITAEHRTAASEAGQNWSW